jgi:N-acyl homoserine lactone hydrolase
MNVHAIQTGTVTIKQAHFQLIGPAALRLASILADPRFTPALPIYAWVIEHPEGVIVIDTGETARTADPDYFNCDPGTGFFFRRNLKMKVSPDQEIGPQLRGLGIPPEEVRWVIMTYLHSDHAGGIEHFPNAQFLVARSEFHGSRQGALPCRWAEHFKPTLVEYVPDAVGAFQTASPLTKTGDVWIVPTPGHSLGHQSVLLRTPEHDILFAGDTTFNESQLRTQTLAGICEDLTAAARSVSVIREQVQSFPTVYLPTHDPDSAQRLATRQLTTLAG